MSEADKAYQALYQAGLVQPRPAVEINPITEDELQRVADVYGRAGSLSDMIIADRDGLKVYGTACGGVGGWTFDGQCHAPGQGVGGGC